MTGTILYQITLFIDKNREDDWHNWMLEKHIPDVMETGYFTSYRMSRLIAPTDSNSPTGYIIEYNCPSLEKYKAYQQKCAPILQKDHSERYTGAFTATRTILQNIN